MVPEFLTFAAFRDLVNWLGSRFSLCGVARLTYRACLSSSHRYSCVEYLDKTQSTIAPAIHLITYLAMKEKITEDP